MDKGRNELRQKMGLTYFEFFRQRTFNYSLATAQLSADLFTRLCLVPSSCGCAFSASCWLVIPSQRRGVLLPPWNHREPG